MLHCEDPPTRGQANCAFQQANYNLQCLQCRMDGGIMPSRHLAGDQAPASNMCSPDAGHSKAQRMDRRHGG